MATMNSTDTHAIALLNDLLQLDHDAVQAYTLALKGLDSETYRETLRSYRSDHERHIRELTSLVEARGGTPIQLPHLPTGAFKLAVQAAGNAGSDREVLLAFRANERQVRDKYLRLANDDGLSADERAVVERNATDEVRHYAWAAEALELLGAGDGTTIGKAERAFESVHKLGGDVIERAERATMEGIERARREFRSRSGRVRARGAEVLDGARRMVREKPVRTAAVAVAAGVLLRRLFR